MRKYDLPTSYSTGRKRRGGYTGDRVNMIFCSILDEDYNTLHAYEGSSTDVQVFRKTEPLNSQDSVEFAVSDTQTTCNITDLTSDSECSIQEYRKSARIKRRRATEQSKQTG